MSIENQLQELEIRIQETDCFITKMELSGELEDLQVKHGLKLPPRPPESPYICEGCSA